MGVAVPSYEGDPQPASICMISALFLPDSTISPSNFVDEMLSTVGQRLPPSHLYADVILRITDDDRRL